MVLRGSRSLSRASTRECGGGPPRRPALWPWGLALLVGMGVDNGRVAALPPTAPRSRAAPPVPLADAPTPFFVDAFQALEGPHPLAEPPLGGGQQGSAPLAIGGAAAYKPPQEGAWSALISADTLVDEVKSQRKVLLAAVASATEFKGGRYAEAQNACSVLALMFALIAAHDGEARWQDQAASACDLFAQAATSCAVGTDEAFVVARARAADLEKLVNGVDPDGRSDRAGAGLWSDVASRSALMTRLESAAGLLAAATPPESLSQREHLRHELEIVAAIGEVIQWPDFVNHDEDLYRRHAGGMRDDALRAQTELEEKTSPEGLQSALGALRKSCDSCHAEYR